MTSHENKELVRFMYSITDNFFRSLIYGTMLFENVFVSLHITRSPSPGHGAFISHTNPLRQPLRVSFYFYKPARGGGGGLGGFDSRAPIQRPLRTIVIVLKINKTVLKIKRYAQRLTQGYMGDGGSW